MLLKKQFTPSEKYEIYEAQKLVIYCIGTYYHRKECNPGQTLSEYLLKNEKGLKRVKYCIGIVSDICRYSASVLGLVKTVSGVLETSLLNGQNSKTSMLNSGHRSLIY